MGIFWALRKIKPFNSEQFINHTHFIYDRNGDLMGYTAPKLSSYTKKAQIPEKVIRSVLSIEDRYFYDHVGISFRGILRSMVFYIPQRLTGHRPRGGSTITQQLIRSVFLDHSFSFYRKIKESFMSLAFELKYSKDYILETYMNHAYFGNNIYGFAMAADVFWGKKLDQLSPDEIAILVSMLKGPNYSPIKNTEKLKKRRDSILKIMFQDEIISKEELEKALVQDISIFIDRFNHFTFLSQESKEFIIENFGLDSFNKGGLKIYTSIDHHIQKIAQSELESICEKLERDTPWEGPLEENSNLESTRKYFGICGNLYVPVLITSSDGHYKSFNFNGKIRESQLNKYKMKKNPAPGDIIIISKKNGFIVNRPSYNGQITIIKNGFEAGDILASVGGIEINLLRDNITKIPREIGSCMKIIDAMIIFDTIKIPTCCKVEDKIAIVKNNKLNYVTKEEFDIYFAEYYTKDKKEVWPPRNWDLRYWQDITFRIAFEHSRNIPFLSLILNDVGYLKFKRYTDLLGVTQEKESFYPAMILGSVGLTPRQFACTITGLVKFGAPISPCLFKEVTDDKDLILYHAEKEQPKRIFSEQSVYATLSMMKGCGIRGSGKKIKNKIQNVYIKHGTTSNNQDAVCLLITKNYVIYVVLCKNDGKSLGKNVWGAEYPVVCCKTIIEQIEQKDTEIMSIPEGITKISYLYNPYASEFVTFNDEIDEFIIN